MSLIGTVANYGGRQPSNTQGIKQFVLGSGDNIVPWTYKRVENRAAYITPVDKNKPVLIDNDLYVTGSIFNPSDVILKENILKINNLKSDLILNLESVEFTFKNDVKQQLHYGFIAQDVEKIYPELVDKSELGFKTINYIELIPLLVTKIQDQQNQIDELKRIVNLLHLKNEKL
jgi:multimeric flavodoxin WrbA